MRNGLTFKRYFDKYGHAPELMSAGFAAYLMFLRPVKKKDGQYFGEFNEQLYPINDDEADYFYQIWMDADLNDPVLVNNVVDKILLHHIWEEDLKNMGDFAAKVKHYLGEFVQKGVKATLAEIVNK